MLTYQRVVPAFRTQPRSSPAVPCSMAWGSCASACGMDGMDGMDRRMVLTWGILVTFPPGTKNMSLKLRGFVDVEVKFNIGT